MPFRVSEEWISHMNNVARSVNIADQEVPASLWRFARDGRVDVDVVTDYLRLLRPSCPSFHLRDPISVPSSLTGSVEPLGTPDAGTIIPCKCNEAWFTTIAYRDCVQVYGVREEDGSRLAQQLPTLFPGRLIRFSNPLPAARSHDTGVLMLLGVQMLARGKVPMQRVGSTFLENARAQLFIGMWMENLDVGVEDSDVSDRIQRAQADDSVYFDNAFLPQENASTPAASTFTADMEEDGGFAFGASPEPATHSSPSAEECRSPRKRTSATGTRMSAQAPYNSLLPSRPTEPTREKLTSLRSGRVFHARIPEMPPLMSKQGKTILDMLSEAVAFYRSSRLSENSELAVILSAIKNGCKSEFYRRYTGVLFYKQMSRLGSDRNVSVCTPELGEMRSLQKQFKIWHDICQLRHEWEDAQYVLLCVLPEKPHLERMSKEEQNNKLAQVYEWLHNPHDYLSSYLEAAKGLCEALVQRRLPCDRLMIDTYHMKAYQQLFEAEFAPYTSLKPQRIPIPRLAPAGA
ncbi:hypothetical protein LY78DRAFT_669477 [Colletotrichum sublineola]|nr:hypothetical protein LY78DRAFT_669477 [Colletotrichum sublineola]